VASTFGPDPIKDATVLGPIKANPCGWPQKTRLALTSPARGGREIWRSGWKNARGAGRTKEWTQENKKTDNFKPLVLSQFQAAVDRG
jgi:hypothetical protein